MKTISTHTETDRMIYAVTKTRSAHVKPTRGTNPAIITGTGTITINEINEKNKKKLV